MALFGKKDDRPVTSGSGAVPQGFVNEVKKKRALRDIAVDEFVLELSSKAPVPGGGGAAALAGALGAALGGMVANLTIGKEKYAAVQEDMQTGKVAAYRVQKELLELIEKDAEVFAPLAGAYRMPADTEEARESKARVMEACLKQASDVPLDMMRKCGEVVELMGTFAEKGNVLAVSDAACGAALAKAAMQAAWLNVCVNTKSLRDRAFADRANSEGKALLEKYLPLADAVFEGIESLLAEQG
ncbi:MAG: cyclodeaminase/cyclohydrolase family protein [Clostridiales Family XIII bacterium]|jgi:formiminotetrahydrofolate cyclodeaminase|nr:cyclodeaminase/cyclohydrolase family protein [Clostridiales Family XIII bacterium]